MTEIKFTTEYGECIVRVNKNGLTVTEVMQELVKPVLLGATYNIENLNEYIPEV